MHQLLLKSLGFGIYIVTIISIGGSKAGINKFLDLIRITDIDISQIIFDSIIERALILSKTGIKPSKYEIKQITDEDWEFLDQLREKNLELNIRLIELENLKQQLKL